MENAQEPRNYCEREIRKLIGNRNPQDQKQWMSDVSVILQQMHLRLTLLEGADPRLLADTHFE